MADYHNLSETLLFDSQFQSGSKLDEDGLQNTAVFYDTMVLDSPLNEIETQLENVCFDTEMVDDVANLGNMEIVLDSEDEGICRTEAERFPDGKTTGRSERKAVDLQKTPCLDIADSIRKHFGAGKKESSGNIDRSDWKKDGPKLSVCDHEIVGRLDYVSSQEPQESSQAHALCFVDTFLNFNDVDMCQGAEKRTIATKTSPLVSTAKGAQRLAKIIKRGSPVKQIETFEWFGHYQHGEAGSFGKRMSGSSEFGGFRQRTYKGYENLHGKGERCLSNELEEKKEFADCHKDIRGPSHLHSSFMEQGLKASILGIEQESERNLIDRSVKEMDQLMQTESSSEQFEASGTERGIPDTFDVGISTQIAVEAMEALFYGPPPACKTSDTCEGQEDTLMDLPKGETMNRTHLEQHSLQKVAVSMLGDIAKQSIRKKRSARRYSKEVSNSSWNCNYQELNYTIKLKPFKNKQSKLDEAVSSNNQEKYESYESPSIADEQTLLRKQASPEEYVIHQYRHLEKGASMSKEQPDKLRVMTNKVKEGSMLTHKRKRKRVVADPPKYLSGKQKFSKLYSNASAEGLDGKLIEQEQTSPQEPAIARILRVDAWNCPRGKRTHRKGSVRFSAARNMHASFMSVGAEDNNLLSVRSQRRPEDDKTTCNNFNMKGQMHTPSWPSLVNNSDESSSRQNCNEQVAVTVTNSDSAVTKTRIFACDLDRSKIIHTGKLDYMDSTSIINGLENHSFGRLLKKSVEPTECNATFSCRESETEASFNNMLHVYQRRPCNKKLLKPSLRKEHVRLGVPESICDFTREGFRPRRELAYVRVLFSQHLDYDIIKQQKKTCARLGISITSCSMDSTHFVADKFVRTRNMLEAIALGKPVVTHLWLDSCGQASCLLDEKNYTLRDSKREKEIGFSMPVSLSRARRYPLLKDKRVCITKNVKPNKEMITSLVKAVGGEVVEISQNMAAKDEKISDDLLILSCERDSTICAPLLDKGAAIYSSELLLKGIVIQKLEFERHRLFFKIVKVKRKTSERNRGSRSGSKH